MKNGFSLIIPVYNEENSIINSLEEISNIFKETDIDFELILVNDGSNDKTSDRINQYNSENNLNLINHDKNRGYGAAIKTGIKNSNYDYYLANC